MCISIRVGVNDVPKPEDMRDVAFDLIHAGRAFDHGKPYGVGCGELTVEGNQRLCLFAVNMQTCAHGVFPIILALNEYIARSIVEVRNARWIEGHVIGSAARFVDTATRYSRHHNLVRYTDFQYMIDHDSGVDQCLGLTSRARKAVKKETAPAVGSADSLLDEIDDGVVGD